MSAVSLVDHQPAWAAEYALVANELAGALAALSPRVEHIGSTSVPGLCAKPVLDVLLGLPALGDLADGMARLAALGYRYRPEHEAQIPDRRYFVREASSRPGVGHRVHLHAVQRGGRLWQEHLAFRDALRDDSALMARYAALKRGLAVAHADDKAAYTEAKAPFIRQVLAGAAHPAARNP